MIITAMNSNVVSLVEDYSCLRLLDAALACVDVEKLGILLEKHDLGGDVIDAVAVIGQVRFTFERLQKDVQKVRADEKIAEAIALMPVMGDGKPN